MDFSSIQTGRDAVLEAPRQMLRGAAEWVAPISGERRLDFSYRYESYHGFLFFLSTLLFIAFWYSLFKHCYGRSSTPPANPTPGQQTGWIARFSSKPTAQAYTVGTNPATKVEGKPDETGKFNQAPIAAYVVDNVGRQSMIPLAVEAGRPVPY